MGRWQWKSVILSECWEAVWWCQPQRQIPVVIRDHKKQRKKFWTLDFFAAVQGILKARVCKWYKCCKVAKQKLLFYSAKFLLSGNLGALFTVQQNAVFFSVGNWQKLTVFWYAGSFGSGLDHLLWIRLRSIWITSSLLKSVLTVVEIFPIWGVEEWEKVTSYWDYVQIQYDLRSSLLMEKLILLFRKQQQFIAVDFLSYGFNAWIDWVLSTFFCDWNI